MFRTFIISSLALLLMTNPAAAKTIFPVVGGSGDAGFQDHCPANEYMTGLAGRAGNVLDEIQIICAPILPNGTQGAKYYGPARGGPGGAVEEFSCASDSFATGDRLRYNDQYNTLTEVDLSCTSMQSNRQTYDRLRRWEFRNALAARAGPVPQR